MKNNCLNSCPENTFITNDNICNLCPSECKKCINLSNCFECNTNFNLKNN